MRRLGRLRERGAGTVVCSHGGVGGGEADGEAGLQRRVSWRVLARVVEARLEHGHGARCPLGRHQRLPEHFPRVRARLRRQVAGSGRRFEEQDRIVLPPLASKEQPEPRLRAGEQRRLDGFGGDLLSKDLLRLVQIPVEAQSKLSVGEPVLPLLAWQCGIAGFEVVHGHPELAGEDALRLQRRLALARLDPRHIGIRHARLGKFPLRQAPLQPQTAHALADGFPFPPRVRHRSRIVGRQSPRRQGASLSAVSAALIFGGSSTSEGR